LGFGLRGFWGSVASGAVTADDFWALIDATRPAEPDPDLHAAALTRDLATRGVDATVAFARQFDAAMDALYRWDLWGGGYLLLGGLSDDGFEYLRAWVVGEGRATWERVLDDPEGYLVALVGEATADGGELFEGLEERCFAEAESLLYAAGTAHEQLTGAWTPPDPERSLGDPAGEEWDEDALDEAFPRLAAALEAAGVEGAIAPGFPSLDPPWADATAHTTPEEALEVAARLQGITWGFETRQIHAGQEPDPTTGARAVPIYQTTSYQFRDSQHASEPVRAGRDRQHLHPHHEPHPGCARGATVAASRGPPTAVGLPGALAVASGQAAETSPSSTWPRPVATSWRRPSLYGGTYNLFHYTLPKIGIEVTFVDDPDDLDAVAGGGAAQHQGVLRREHRQPEERRPRHPRASADVAHERRAADRRQHGRLARG
jgi:hypothetical protein